MASATVFSDDGAPSDPTLAESSVSGVGRSRWAVWAAILVALVLLLEVGPSSLRLAEQSRHLDVLDAQLAEAEGASAEIRRLGQRRARLERQLPVEASMPVPGTDGVEDDLGLRLAVLRLAVERSGAQLERVTPGERSGEGVLEQQPVEIRVSGSGHDVGRLLSELERQSGALRVQAVAVAGVPTQERVTATVTVAFVERRS